jgi:hypothetical protein
MEAEMAKYSLAKTIEARRLNKRTGVPTTDPAVTVPFGAIIDNVDEEGDTRRFTYQGDLYRVPEDVLLSALDRSSAAAPAAVAAPAAEPAAPARAADPVGAAAAPAQADARLRWEDVPTSHGQLLRAKVPGGWLVSFRAGLSFYPDPRHTWDGESPT